MSDSLVMEVSAPGQALRPMRRPVPEPQPHELLIAVRACGVCRTDLHVVDGDIPACHPIVPGHEIVGTIVAFGAAVVGFALGQRVGVPWLGGTCGLCRFCRTGRENLCDAPVFTGATRDGGYATHVVADAAYCFAIPERFADAEAAPLLCAGLIGWRALRMAGDAPAIGFYGFGAAAHLLTQIAVFQHRRIYAFVKPGDSAGQAFAHQLGCVWAGGSDEVPPEALDAAIIFAPVGALIPRALKAVSKGWRVVCAGIHMSAIPSFPYADLWGERSVMSVANLTRADGVGFLEAADTADVRPVVEIFHLREANKALDRLRNGTLTGAAVLVPDKVQTPS